MSYNYASLSKNFAKKIDHHTRGHSILIIKKKNMRMHVLKKRGQG